MATTPEPIPFFDAYALADCAARALAQWRTSKNPESHDVRVRQILRSEPVRALRYLWRTGDAGQRTTVACRILVWLDSSRPMDGVPASIKAREQARADGQPVPTLKALRAELPKAA